MTMIMHSLQGMKGNLKKDNGSYKYDYGSKLLDKDGYSSTSSSSSGDTKSSLLS